MTGAFVLCCDCRKSIDPRRDYRQVKGWEQQRGAGGLHALKHRVETGKWLCRLCYDLRSLNGQGSIF